jgi:hypothetical protein
MTTVPKVLRLDRRGRISLAGVIAHLDLRGVSGFTVTFDPEAPTRLILDPISEKAAAGAGDAMIEISVRDARRLHEILNDDAPPAPQLVEAAARFALRD